MREVYLEGHGLRFFERTLGRMLTQSKRFATGAGKAFIAEPTDMIYDHRVQSAAELIIGDKPSGLFILVEEAGIKDQLGGTEIVQDGDGRLILPTPEEVAQHSNL